MPEQVRREATLRRSSRRPRFVAIGHVTNDHLAAGVVPGGSALYAGLAAAYLGCQAHIVTRHGPDFTGLATLAAAGVTVEGGGGPRTTTFENVYEDGVRRSRLLAVAEPLTEAAVADIVFCCPVAGEVAASAVRGPLVGAGLQGWLRSRGDDGTVRRAPPGDLSFLGGCRAVFLSDADADDAAELSDRLARLVPIVVLTHGAAGATLYADGEVTLLPAVPAHEVDPTGAGDVFAATFLIALARGQAPVTAGHFAARAAAIVVEDVGPAALPRLAMLR